ncbi:MAG: hypothetical protein HDS54_07890 [Barnesiella sp.]|nr:hypothetical protein [Barnesiella sp.]MBD5257304.1 hypothetical protein [Barnesiella sp.]
MKHYLIPTIAFGMIGLASCSSDDVAEVNNDGPVTFRVEIPGSLSSRATLGDQIVADVDNLQWAVYEVTGTAEAPVYTFIYADSKAGAFPGESLVENVSINLGSGKNYKVVFYADVEANDAVKFTDGKIAVDYAAMASNTVAEDAFTAVSATISGSNALPQTVVLTRPFAQLNWGTSDLNAGTVKPSVETLTAAVTVKGSLYTSLDVINGTYDAAETDVTFGAVNVKDIDAGYTFPVAGYDLLAMNYLLTGDAAIECTLTFNNGFDAVVVNNVPVQTNYRTNIYGALLTNPADFNIVIKPGFDGDNGVEYPQEIPAANADELTAAIENAQDGDIIKLTQDMDLSATGAIALDKNITLTVPEGVTVTTARQGNDANFIVADNTTVTLEGDGTYAGDNRIFDVNGTLIVKGGNMTTSTKTRGSAITVNPGGELQFDDGNVTAANCALWIEGKVTINGGKIASTNSPSDPEVGTNWSYAVRLRSSDAELTINGGEIEGVQGAIANPNGTLTINDGYFHTHPAPAPIGGNNYYALYIGDSYGSVTTINGGKFYSQNTYSVYYVKQYAGYAENVLNLNGGEFNNKGRQVVNSIDEETGKTVSTGSDLVPSDGHKWNEISDGNFKFEVVKE